MAAPGRRPVGALLWRPFSDANYRRLMVFLGGWTLAVTLAQPQYQSAELLLGVLAHGFRVAERPLTMRPRTSGRGRSRRSTGACRPRCRRRCTPGRRRRSRG